SSYVYPPPPFSEEEKKRQAEELTDTLIAQPALGAVEMGLLSLFQRFGLKPDMVAGHSYGEYVALYAAGVISKDDLLLLSEQRGRSMKQAAQKTPGKMLAVSAPAEKIEKLLQGIPDVWLANYNAPRQTIIAGSSDALENAGKRLQAEGIRTQPIAVSCPFHTPLLEPARERFAKILAEVSFSKPTCELFSNSTGKPYPSDPGSIREQLKQHLVRPVQFADEIEAMFDSGGRVFLEIGPRN